jgi:hypothetical protein
MLSLKKGGPISPDLSICSTSVDFANMIFSLMGLYQQEEYCVLGIWDASARIPSGSGSNS